MKFKTLIVSSTLFAALMSPALAESLRYNHNGSTMLVKWEGKSVTIRYDNPRSSLLKHGVKSGTLLFSGKLDKLGNGTPYVEGDARIFRQGCSPTPYYVYGDLIKGRDFKLAGAAPVLAKGSCRIIDNIYTGSNANLVFTAVASSSKRSSKNEIKAFGWGELCVTGVRTSLNIRTGPGVSYGRIGELPANACDLVSLNQCINGWCVVKRNIEIGWVSNAYLKKR